MKIISVNAGSSSLKFKLFDMPKEELIFSGLIEKIGDQKSIFSLSYGNTKKETIMPVLNHQQAVKLLLDSLQINKIIDNLEEIKGVGHRIVQGGELFKDSVVLTEENILKIESLNDLAPLHNYANVLGIKAFEKNIPNIFQVGVFDTTFHQTIKQENFSYAIPYEWYQKYKIRKYGFHGISYKYVSNRTSEILANKDSKIIVCHAGNGVSLCAIEGNNSVDTSMGFTPLEGVPMGTRSGNIDPTIIEFISYKENKSIKEIMNILNKKSGFLGVSGVSNDARDIEISLQNGNKRSLLAHDVQIKRICDYIGSYYFLLKGIDALVFTAGMGENSSLFRKKIIQRLSFLGVFLDDEFNNSKGERIISTSNSFFKVLVIPTNEEIEIVREVCKIKN
ncbi:Acetate kinase [Candidatus Phytoplasma mali]|uniref:Acetate kinase n=1 Tax=Phytoplasma mali (strain AT) TaxID=482235 RepID=ACKA_PHYMT|nr:acetate kinase [Candidatus Phytoplasma mali]B3QZW9.1 RecName: Full=Acetate kinase; AltName: Full=Acetokinase [Candidatus Phytoplasma mali AT]CAP18506.1 Acetate kinase [Candidatus Phytoplasma mali]